MSKEIIAAESQESLGVGEVEYVEVGDEDKLTRSSGGVMVWEANDEKESWGADKEQGSWKEYIYAKSSRKRTFYHTITYRKSSRTHPDNKNPKVRPARKAIPLLHLVMKIS
jgi:hypothetical protein